MGAPTSLGNLIRIASHNEARSVFLCFLGAFCAFKLSVRNVFEPIRRYLPLGDEMACVGGILYSVAHSLEEPSELVGGRRAPRFTDDWIVVVDQLSVF